jgi:putative flippase GtrA
MLQPGIVRFLKYTAVGVSTFLVDLVLLFILTDALEWNYLVATAIAFILAISINFFLSRVVVFKYSKRSVHTGYIFFIVIAGLGLAIVVSGMYVLVSILGFNYIVSRIAIAGIVGCWNYLLNLYANFQVAGIH